MTNFNETFARLLEKNDGKLVIRIRNMKNEDKTSPTRRKFHKKTRATAPPALAADEAVVLLDEEEEEDPKKKPVRQPIKTPQLSTPKKARRKSG
jgi:hypothetical protein